MGQVTQVEELLVDVLFLVTELECPEFLDRGLEDHEFEVEFAHGFDFFFIVFFLDVFADILEHFELDRNDLAKNVGKQPDGHDDNRLETPFKGD